MKLRRTFAVGAAATIAVASVFTFHTAAHADQEIIELGDPRADAVSPVDPRIVEAMAEANEETPAEVYNRLAVQDLASEVEEQWHDHPNFGGVWVDETAEEIFLATTDAKAIVDPRATTVEVNYTVSELAEYVDLLVNPAEDHSEADSLASPSQLETDDVDSERDNGEMRINGPGIHGGFVNVMGNLAVVEAVDSEPIEELAAREGIPSDAYTVDVRDEGNETFLADLDAETQVGLQPRFDDNPNHIYGGDTYHAGGVCTVGFGVIKANGGAAFVTAGHCGSVGTTVTHGTAEGSIFTQSVFPGSDAAVVDVPPHKTMMNAVRAASHVVQIQGSKEAPVGATVCKYSMLHGISCGVIEARNVSVTYPQGMVRGLTRTNICSEPGDSGAPVISSAHAQGIVSGGSGNCSMGGTTFIQPINPILNAWNLTLGGATPPTTS
ncbi:S1 family peptidase [Natronoglycomyces albus]|uniref:Trypsin-like serine protease n=1 Tax=Natronoglycomyces albus TaxID=2811108 RepID=A0A895XDW2_9ACTN|nr:S1 family peptidase [Natronoglycomyces albus]QSB03991.1 trypsin-like serine protease [Natronoglycomyces albus]